MQSVNHLVVNAELAVPSARWTVRHVVSAQELRAPLLKGPPGGHFTSRAPFSRLIHGSIDARLVKPHLAETSVWLMKVAITPGSVSWRSAGYLLCYMANANV